MTAYITSDFHLGHKNILKYQPNRLAELGLHADSDEKNVELMNDKLVGDVNALLRAGHDVYHVGDLTLGGKHHYRHYLAQMVVGYRDESTGLENPDFGTLYLMPGNHDRRQLNDEIVRNWPHVVVLEELLIIDRDANGVTVHDDGGGEPDPAHRIVICHYPLEIWPGMLNRPDGRNGGNIGRLVGSVHLHGHSHGHSPHAKDRLDVGIDAQGRILTLEQAVERARSVPERPFWKNFQ